LLGAPSGVAVDQAGNLLIADRFNIRIRFVSAADGVIRTIAGSGLPGFSPDLVSAVGATISLLQGVAFDPMGTVHFSDTFNFSIRKVVRAAPGDVTPPTVLITEPTSSPSYTASDGSISIGGTATDNSPIVQVRWSNDRGGSGVAIGTNEWTISA